MANAFCHVELNTTDTDAAKKFYKTVFDWKLSEEPAMGGYTMIDVGKGGVGGGIMKKQMAEAPNAWLPYVIVADVKKTIENARDAGAQIVVEYMPIGSMGAIGVFIDPQGAALGVWAQAKNAAQKAGKKKSKKAGKKKSKKAGKKKSKKAGKKKSKK